jgi:hypothetical protein
VTVTCTCGFRVTIAVPDLVESATLVAFTVTVWELAIEVGAVYRPAEVMLPTTGLSDQVTIVAIDPVLGPLPAVFAKNCCVCRGPSETEPGETVIIVAPTWGGAAWIRSVPAT